MYVVCKLVCKASRQAGSLISDTCNSKSCMQLLLKFCTDCHCLPKDKGTLSKPKVFRLGGVCEARIYITAAVQLGQLKVTYFVSALIIICKKVLTSELAWSWALSLICICTKSTQ